MKPILYNIRMALIQKADEGIYTTSANAYTLEECPMVYKSIDDIVDNINSTAEILQTIKRVYNFKAGLE